MLGEHGLDQLSRPSSTRSFDAMELAIIVAIQPHIPASRTRSDPAGMTHEDCAVLAACSCSAKRTVHIVSHVTPVKVDALRLRTVYFRCILATEKVRPTGYAQ